MKKQSQQKTINTQIVEQLVVTVTLLKKSGDERIFKQFGLTTSLFATLTKIAAGINTGTELQKYIDGTPASITQKLKQLEGKGIIARRLDEDDKRRWIFEITDDGFRILDKIRPVYEAQVASLLEGYDATAKKDLFTALKILEERLRI